MIVPVWHSRQSSALEAEVERIRGALAQAGVRVAVDARRCWPGVRFGAAERQGVPLRIEVRGVWGERVCAVQPLMHSASAQPSMYLQSTGCALCLGSSTLPPLQWP